MLGRMETLRCVGKGGNTEVFGKVGKMRCVVKGWNSEL